MEHNVILAGVGGQGILTIARAISIAAMRRGMHVKQAEVHGMSQRGGAVQSHLRISDNELFSDLIPAGGADLIISVEPLESLRYTDMLHPDGTLVASTNSFVNIGNYPPVEELLSTISDLPNHILIDADKVARAAGSGRSANIASLGAASIHLQLDPKELEDAVAEMFAAKGEKVVNVNRRAFWFGRHAAEAYLSGLSQGGSSKAVRHWIETLKEEDLADPERPDAPVFEAVETEGKLTGAESHAVERTLMNAYEEGRSQLYEHEVYQIIQLIGAIHPPRHVFVRPDELVTDEVLSTFSSDQVVLKIVSPDIVHKSDANGISFCARDCATVRREIDNLMNHHRGSAHIEGVLLVEYIPHDNRGLGSELFVGIRATREFGPVIAAGLGGTDAEYLASTLKSGLAVAKAIATDITAEDFLELFKRTAAYDVFSGRARGHERIVSDGELLRCFRAFIHLAQRFCVDRGDVGPDVAELEVNPFAFQQQRLVPLDGHGHLATATVQPDRRPLKQMQALLEPQSIAIVGVSAQSMNFGRIILRNILDCGYDREHLHIVKPDTGSIEGVSCTPSIRDIGEPIDLLVLAVSAPQLPDLIDQAVASGKVRSVIIIPGGVGETEGTTDVKQRVHDAIKRARLNEDVGGPVFLGPNCLGVQSRPGKYDTFFIPESKLDPRRDAPARRLALISQSGAFIVSRLSNVESLAPAITISFGNQLDLTVSDLLHSIGDRDDIDTIGLYVEGFNDLDGLTLLRTIRKLRNVGKTIVFYKAGRTLQGRDAASGHTASIAGDYDICEAGAAHAGALVADTFKEFEQLLELSAALHDRTYSGTQLGAISNAGFETVGIADNVRGTRYNIDLATLSSDSKQQLAQAMEQNGLSQIVNLRNPVDLTPMAGAIAYEDAARILLTSNEVDALLVSCVPLTPAIATTATELEREPNSLANRFRELARESSKPIAIIIDAGSRFETLVAAFRDAGLPVFRSSDQAVRSFARYLQYRHEVNKGEKGKTTTDEPTDEAMLLSTPATCGA